VSTRSPSKLEAYLDFSRPFTLLPPAIGMVSGSLTALGATTPDAGRWTNSWAHGPTMLAVHILVGAVMASCLNAFSNGLNQICDLEIDRVNKPHRPLCDGRLSKREAWWLTGALLVVALALAAIVGWQCLALAGAASVFTTAYSSEPLRMKRRGVWANVSIAVPRGLLLKVCGWSVVKDVLTPEPWIIGSVFGLFLLGASTTKDFADMKGDRAGGCETLPVRYGLRKSAAMISPFFVLPFAGLAVGAQVGWFTGNRAALTALGVALALWGTWVARSMLRDPEALASTENHPAWTQMYVMMLVLQVGFAAAYLVSV